MSRHGFRPIAKEELESAILQLVDLGLDFRSYTAYHSRDGSPLLGNMFHISVKDLAAQTQPTVGLLVAILHAYHASSQRTRAQWIEAYMALQQKVATASAPEIVSAAHSAIQLLATQPPLDERLYDKLMIYLDAQCMLRGNQTPSQRKLGGREPKAVLCNLHVTSNDCHQAFSCNQVHLDPAVAIMHRRTFFVKLVDVLRSRGMQNDEILYRLKDIIFFAKYGHRVTVRSARGWVNFFKTTYTRGRLEHVLSLNQRMCTTPHCPFGADCVGIHLQDERNVQFTKPIELTNPGEVHQRLHDEALAVMQGLDVKRSPPMDPSASAYRPMPAPPYAPGAPVQQGQPKNTSPQLQSAQPPGNPPPTSAPFPAPQQQRNKPVTPPPLPKPQPLDSSISASPITREWEASVQKFVSEQHIHAHSADAQFVSQLQATRGETSPAQHSDSSRLTPLLNEVNLHRYDSDVSVNSSNS